MSRSPLAYPLTRGIDGDSGGAADLQTDIMRFMAILALCLVAIFALVQSIPITPNMPLEAVVETPVEVVPSAGLPAVQPQTVQPAKTVQLPTVQPQTVQPAPAPPLPVVTKPITPQKSTTRPQVALTRPKWQSNFESKSPTAETRQPTERTVKQTVPAAETKQPNERIVEQTTPAEPTADASPSNAVEPDQPAPSDPSSERNVFTLRFSSNLALTRLVADGTVGFYAIESGRAQRMTVKESRISFWNASTPNTFHEMEAMTVPRPVVEALARTGTNAQSVSWGVTLPGNLRTELDKLMQQHDGGALVINSDGRLTVGAP